MSIECYSKDLKGLLLWIKDTTCGWTKDSTATHRETERQNNLDNIPSKMGKIWKEWKQENTN